MPEQAWRLNTRSLLSMPSSSSLDGGSDGPHGGPGRHPACQPLQGEDVYVRRGVRLLSQSGQSRVKGQKAPKTLNETWLWHNIKVYFLLPVQEEVYRATTRGLIEGLISGYNATVFAYGPTGLCVCVCVLHRAHKVNYTLSVWMKVYHLPVTRVSFPLHNFWPATFWVSTHSGRKRTRHLICSVFLILVQVWLKNESRFTSHVSCGQRQIVKDTLSTIYPSSYPSVSLTSSALCRSICLRDSQLFCLLLWGREHRGL